MKKQFITLIILAFGCIKGFAQVSSIEYFEVFTKLAHPRQSSGFSFNRDSILAKINNVPDTASTLATFVISSQDVASVDSLFFTLTNSQGQVVYTAAHKLSVLRTNASFKQNGNGLYYTVGPYPYLKKFTATAKVRTSDGQTTPIKSFAKN